MPRGLCPTVGVVGTTAFSLRQDRMGGGDSYGNLGKACSAAVGLYRNCNSGRCTSHTLPREASATCPGRVQYNVPSRTGCVAEVHCSSMRARSCADLPSRKPIHRCSIQRLPDILSQYIVLQSHIGRLALMRHTPRIAALLTLIAVGSMLFSNTRCLETGQ